VSRYRAPETTGNAGPFSSHSVSLNAGVLSHLGTLMRLPLLAGVAAAVSPDPRLVDAAAEQNITAVRTLLKDRVVPW
jgi:hypothetical protein